MFNRHNKAIDNTKIDLTGYFNNPAAQRQKQYEAVRAVVIEHTPIKTVARKFGYKPATLYSLLKDARAGKITLFPEVRKGPQSRRFSLELQDKIIACRKQQLSSVDIQQKLAKDGVKISDRTVERILKDAGFGKLKRRTNKERGQTSKNKIIPDRSLCLDFTKLEPFNIDCPAAGIFFFIPYIIESGILDIVKKCASPSSSDIGCMQAVLSMLLLKLIGEKRLTHIGTYDQEPGLGVFAGLNILPKPTYMSTYSCRFSEGDLLKLQYEIISSLKNKYASFYESPFINLDFHTIPHYGDEAAMEKIWCGTKNKSLKAAHTVFAQDSQSNAIIYTRADILRSEESSEVKKFVDYWKQVNGNIDETLVFDCKFTNYKILDELHNENIKFITLRKRHEGLIEKTLLISKEKWQKVYIDIPKRKYKRVSIYAEDILLKGNTNRLRQIIIKDHGRINPTYILTNNRELSIKDILKVYARRWHIENKLAELVAFFNLNALSSPVMIRIHFDILWTIIADTLYHIFAQDLKRFEEHLAPAIFRKFIDTPGRVVYDGNKFLIKIRKRAYTPILKGVQKINRPFRVPWLNNKFVEIVWTA